MVCCGWRVTIAGTIGTFIRDWVQQRHDAKKRRADKFEELLAAVYEYDYWLDGMRGRAVGTDWEVYKHDSPPPFAKVQAISAVYFPQFCHFIDDLYETGTSYMVWSHKAEQKRISKTNSSTRGSTKRTTLIM